MASVIYEDEVLSGCVGCQCAGTSACSGCGGLGLNLPNIVKGILTATGLRDPLNTYEPGVPERDVAEKYCAWVDEYAERLSQIRDSGAQTSLKPALRELQTLQGRARNAYLREGAKAGSTDRSDLAYLVDKSLMFRRDLWAAEKKYGTDAVAAGSPEAITASVKGKGGAGGLGILPILLIGGAVLLLGIKALK